MQSAKVVHKEFSLSGESARDTDSMKIFLFALLVATVLASSLSEAFDPVLSKIEGETPQIVNALYDSTYQSETSSSFVHPPVPADGQKVESPQSIQSKDIIEPSVDSAQVNYFKELEAEIAATDRLILRMTLLSFIFFVITFFLEEPAW